MITKISNTSSIILLLICICSFGYFGIRDNSPFSYLITYYSQTVAVICFFWLMFTGRGNGQIKAPVLIVGIEIIWWALGAYVLQKMTVPNSDMRLARDTAFGWIFLGFLPLAIYLYFKFKRELKEAEEEDKRNGII